MTIDAFHLPGLVDRDVERWAALEYGGAMLRVPVLRAGVLARLAQSLRAAREQHLEPRTAREIARIIDRAAELMLARTDLRSLLDDALPRITGYSPAMAGLVVERMAELWRLPALERLLDAELAGGRALDEFIADPARGVRSRAFGPALALHIFSGNVPGVAVTSIVRTLLVKAALLGKTASGEPLLPVLFAKALSTADADVGRCIGITYWPGDEEALAAEALETADLIVVYGGEAVARAVQRRAPATTRVVEHGPRVSIGLIAREALNDEASARSVAEDAARAVATFDQQGCVSPHAIFVEIGGRVEPRAFAGTLAGAMAALAASLPRGTVSTAEAAAVHEARAAAEFRAIAGEDVEVFAGAGIAWTVIWDATPRFEPSPLNRTIRVHAVARLEDVPVLIEPLRSFIQTIALAGPAPRIAALAYHLARAGATRLTSFARMPWPSAAGHHDGSGPLQELVRWVDLEER